MNLFYIINTSLIHAFQFIVFLTFDDLIIF